MTSCATVKTKAAMKQWSEAGPSCAQNFVGQRRHQQVFDCKVFSGGHGWRIQIVFVCCVGRDFLVASFDDLPRGLFAAMNPYSRLQPFDRKSGALNVVIDTPKGSRNKFAWDEELELFSLTGVLPAGAVFPYDFGFIPNTRGGDGDPLDVLIVMDEPAFVGCLVSCRLLGVIEAKQTEEGRTERNDRLIAVSNEFKGRMKN